MFIGSSPQICKGLKGLAVGVDPGTALEPGALLLGPRPRRESRPGLGQAESHISQFALFSWEQRLGCR